MKIGFYYPHSSTSHKNTRGVRTCRHHHPCSQATGQRAAARSYHSHPTNFAFPWISSQSLSKFFRAHPFLQQLPRRGQGPTRRYGGAGWAVTPRANRIRSPSPPRRRDVGEFLWLKKLPPRPNWAEESGAHEAAALRDQSGGRRLWGKRANARLGGTLARRRPTLIGWARGVVATGKRPHQWKAVSGGRTGAAALGGAGTGGGGGRSILRR